MAFWNSYDPAAKRVLNTYQSVLGSNLLEFWHAGLGISTSSSLVTSWTGQIRGTTLQPNATQYRPTYGADGTYFRGKSVVKFSYSSITHLYVTGLSPLGNDADYHYIFTVNRYPVASVASADPSGTDYILPLVSIETTNARNSSYPSSYSGSYVYHYIAATSPSKQVSAEASIFFVSPGYPSAGSNGNLRSDFGENFSDGPWCGVSTHFHELITNPSYLVTNSTRGYVGGFVDMDAAQSSAIGQGWSIPSTDYQSNNPQGKMTGFRFGSEFSPSTRGTDASLAIVGVCSNTPSTDQRAALMALAKLEWGF